MAQVSYSHLLTWVPNQLMASNRTLVDEMPNVIRQSEEHLYGAIERDLFHVKLTGPFSISPGSSSVDLASVSPQVFETRSVNLQYRSGWVPLEVRDRNYLRMIYSTARGGVPRYYCEEGGVLQLAFYPTPSQSYQLEVYANQQPLALGVSQETNSLTTLAPRLVEMTTCYFGALFMKNAPDTQKFEQEMNKSLMETNAQVSRRRRDDTGERPRETANVKGT